MKISFWSDFNCPYCYIGFTRLNKAIDELKLDDVKLNIHSFELDPKAPNTPETTTLNRFAQKYDMSEEDADKEIKKIIKWGLDDGLILNYETAPFTNSRNAHRLTKLAIESNNQHIINKLINLLFEAYFTENLELASKENLINIGVKAGLEKEKVIEVLESNKYDTEVELDERVALETGIQGVPYYIFNNKYAVPGVLPFNEFINVLKKIKFEEDLAKEYATKQCKPDSS